MNDANPERTAHVLHVIDHLDIGGAQQSLSILVRELKKKNIEQSVLTLHGQGAYVEKLHQLNIKTLSLSSIKSNPLILFKLMQTLKKLKPDIVHTHLAVSCVMVAIAHLFKRNFEMISHVRSENQFKFGQGWLKPIHAWANSKARHVIAVSEQVKDWLTEDEKVPKEKITVIANCFDAEFTTPEASRLTQYKTSHGLQKASPILATVTRLDINKGLTHLIEAVSLLKTHFPGIKLILVGEGPDRQLLEDMTLQKGLCDQILFTGYLNNDSKSAESVSLILHLADLFVLPTYFEGFPVSVLEAMARQVPVVCTNVSGISGNFQDGVDLTIIPFKDNQATADGIIKCLELGADERKNMIQRAYAKAVEKFSSRRLATKILTVYKSACNKSFS